MQVVGASLADDVVEKATLLSVASTEDLAADNISDDEDIPPMMMLERGRTMTEYNEVQCFEWQRGHAIPCQPTPNSASSTAEAQCMPMYPPQPSNERTPTAGFDADFHDQESEMVETLEFAQHSADTSAEAHAHCDGCYQAFCTEHQRDTPTTATYADVGVLAYVNRGDVEVIHQFQYGQSESSSASRGLSLRPAAQDGTVDIARLAEQLSAGGESRRRALSFLKGRIASMSFQHAGCRVVQQAIDVASQQEAMDLAAELRGCVRSASQSPHANYVLQKIVETLPVAFTVFVAEELSIVTMSVARNKYGCRILNRIFEHSANEPSTAALADKLVGHTAMLARHSFAHHVLETILQHGLARQKTEIVVALAADFWASSLDRNASYVIASSLVHTAAADRQILLKAYSEGGSELVESLSRGQNGNRVRNAIAKASGVGQQAQTLNTDEDGGTQSGRRMMQSKGRFQRQQA